MADNNSGSSFLNTAKDFAVGAYDQTKQEFSRVKNNSAERQQLFDRETNANLLTSRQQEQLKKISNADDAQRFVEAAQLYGASGGQKEYEEIMGNQRKALISFGTNVAELAVGGAAVKGGLKLGGSIFKGGAEAIGSKLPSLKNVSNVFKSETDLANEAKVIADAKKAAATAQREADAMAKNQKNWKNKQKPPSEPFKSNTEKLAEKAKEEVADETTPNKKGYIRKTLEWMGNKAAGAGKFVGRGALEEGKTLGKTALKGGMYGAAASGIAAGAYNMLPEEYQNSVKEGAQSLVDQGFEKLPGLVDTAGNVLKGAIEGTTEEGAWDNIKKKGGELLNEYGVPAAGAALGAYVGSNSSSPFKGVMGGMGTLMSSGNSAESTLSSMPSGGDSGTTGESHFGSGDLSGKSAVDVLNSIYSILCKTYDTVKDISKDVSTISRGQSQQDASSDLSSANLKARQNEGGGGGSASPIFGGGGGESSADLNKEDETEAGSGMWSKVLKKIPLGKVLKGAAVGGVGNKLASAGKVLSSNKGKIAGVLGAGAMLVSKDLDGEFEKQGITDPYAKEAIKAKMMSESGGKGGAEGDWTKTSNTRIREKMPQLAHMNDQELTHLKSQGNEVFLNKAYEKDGGFKYRGRGLTQLTGKKNYAAADKALGLNGELVNNPDILATDKEMDKKASVWFYKNAGADKQKFDNQEDANKWAINKAGGKKYKPGTALADAELDKVNKIQKSTKDGIQPTAIASASAIKPGTGEDSKTAPETGAYGDIPESEKLDAPKYLLHEVDLGGGEKATWKTDLETSKETLATPDDIKADKAQKEEEKQWIEKHKSNSPTKPENTKPTASPLSKEESAMLAEVDDIDSKREKINAEREEMASTVDVSKEQYDKDLARSTELSGQMGELNQKRNNIAGTQEYSDAARKQNNPSAAPQQQAAPQQAAAPPPQNNPGSAKSVPRVRNDDPTIKMMEEGNMWRTNTHEA